MKSTGKHEETDAILHSTRSTITLRLVVSVIVLLVAEGAVSAQFLSRIDINPDGSELTSSWPGEFLEWEDNLYFTAWDSVNARELWKYNWRTEATRVTDLNPCTDPTWCGLTISKLTLYDDQLFFVALAANAGEELWRYTPDLGPSLAADINPGEPGSSPSIFRIHDGGLYFHADDGSTGGELWRYTSLEGARRLTDLNPGRGNSRGFPLASLGEQLIFLGQNNETNDELWAYSESTGAVPLGEVNRGTDGSRSTYHTVLDGQLYFSAWDGNTGQELWEYDPRTGITQAADIQRGLGDGKVRNLTAFGDQLVFQADDGQHGPELWRYDPGGRASIAADINAGRQGSKPAFFATFRESLVFSADDGRRNGRESLFVYDGQNAVRVPFGGYDPYGFTDVNGLLYFFASIGNGSAHALFAYDGNTVSKAAGDFVETNRNRSSGVFDGEFYFSAELLNDTAGTEVFRLTPAAEFVTEIPIAPNATYLHLDSTDVNAGSIASVPIDLGKLGIASGDALILQAVGDFKRGTGAGKADISTRTIGVLSATDKLRVASRRIRLADARDRGQEEVTAVTLQ